MQKINLDMNYQDWCSAITNMIEISDYQNSWFWIIDGCGHPDFQSIMRDSASTLDAWPIFMNTYQDDVRQAGPWFIRHEAGHGINQWLFDKMTDYPLGLLVKALRYDESVLFEHFQCLFECIMPDGKSGVFRYYDPRLLYALCTSENNKALNLICGPALEINAWEPGRAIPINLTRSSPEYTLCQEPMPLSDDLLDHLWREVQCHTIINTLGEEYGKKLRSRQLPEAYSFVASVQSILRRSIFTDNQDVALAVVYVLLTGSQESLERIVNGLLAGKYPPDQSFQDIIGQKLDNGLV